MIASTGRGLLLTCLWYIREVDPQTLLLTGLTRDGVYLVENGEVTGAVNNFRFNESPVGMLGAAARGGRHRADAAARVGRLLQPGRDAAGAGGGLQHVLGEPGQLTPRRTGGCRPGLAAWAYRGSVRMSHSGRRPPVHLVTQARRSLSDDIAYRQRRYLLMMGIRAVCFVIAVVPVRQPLRLADRDTGGRRHLHSVFRCRVRQRRPGAGQHPRLHGVPAEPARHPRLRQRLRSKRGKRPAAPSTPAPRITNRAGDWACSGSSRDLVVIGS